MVKRGDRWVKLKKQSSPAMAKKQAAAMNIAKHKGKRK